ncbi:hypothetical protein MIMGU_mgv1a021644mg [Erythranthe guttata]|uniref:Secreted protein n=1 Tax=Erythranthe guttata TaxID=4155 RepID=A0A022QJJ2_ERYGU|nr:hypothetical protein MIMGU_mgv1a021644mg [Erythranthe guttata]
MAIVMIMLYTLLVCSSSTHGRKLLVNVKHNTRSFSSSSDRSLLYLTALPKGNVPASTPTKKGHVTAPRHLAAVDRILTSVPSPGVGH